jgi:hypothetical protein
MLGYADKDAFANLQGVQNLNNRMMQKLSNNRYGLYSNNPVKPNLNGMIFKTDENGVPTPLNEDEMALLKQKSQSTSMDAAREAASPSPVPPSSPFRTRTCRTANPLSIPPFKVIALSCLNYPFLPHDAA